MASSSSIQCYPRLPVVAPEGYGKCLSLKKAYIVGKQVFWIFLNKSQQEKALFIEFYEIFKNTFYHRTTSVAVTIFSFFHLKMI